ncbi:MAG TPA: hypothetical protein VOA87_22365, partial [Thermoanaerobaculia bacterium]|nr:hypothetical protein [Thermoanaerobaculia bacterium]
MKNAPVRHRVEYGCYLVFKGFLRALPHAAARRVGVGLGALGYHLDQGHRRVALRNLELAMPELDPKARRRLTAACFRHFGGALGDVISSSRFDLTELCRRFTYEGWEYLDEAASAGKGVLGLSAHLGYWEASALPIGVYKESLHVVGRPADNPHLDRELVHLRERFGNQNVPKQRAVRKLLQVMAAGG